MPCCARRFLAAAACNLLRKCRRTKAVPRYCSFRVLMGAQLEGTGVYAGHAIWAVSYRWTRVPDGKQEQVVQRTEAQISCADKIMSASGARVVTSKKKTQVVFVNHGEQNGRILKKRNELG